MFFNWHLFLFSVILDVRRQELQYQKLQNKMIKVGIKLQNLLIEKD
jgi:hypothetical protein